MRSCCTGVMKRASEHFLVLELLVAEAHQRFERDLIAQPVVTAHLGTLAAMKRSTRPKMLA
jgi:hypothetical protein